MTTNSLNQLSNNLSQLSDTKKIEEVIKVQLKEKEDICNTLESEIVHMRKKLEKSTRRSIVLDEILNH
jgi:hypothetical protein